MSGLQKNPMSAGGTQNTGGTSVVVKKEDETSSLLQSSQAKPDSSRSGEISNESYPVPVPEIKIEEDCEDVDGEAEEDEEDEYYPVSITKIEELILPLDDILENEVKVENFCEDNPNVSSGSQFILTAETQINRGNAASEIITEGILSHEDDNMQVEFEVDNPGEDNLNENDGEDDENENRGHSTSEKEMVLSDDDVGEIRSQTNSENSPLPSQRRRSPVYKPSPPEYSPSWPLYRRENEVCDIFSVSSDKVSKLISEPELMNQYVDCEIIVDEGRSSKISKVLELLSKCGNQFTGLLVRMRYVEEDFQFLKRALQTVTKVKSLAYQYQHGQDVLQFLTDLKVGKKEGHLPDLNLLKLFSASGNESLTNEHVTMLSEVGTQFKSLEIGDALWEDVKPESLHKLLENCKSSLESLIIHGGYRGRSDKTQKVLTFPQMEILSNLEICPKYEFVSEVKNPSFLFEKSRIENLYSENDEHFKITVKLGNSFPKLKHLVLGSLIEIEDFYFSTVRNLIKFRCGSYWNLSLNFPPDSSRKSLLQSNVTEIQFPDALKDPSFPEKVRKHFPNLNKVHINLPSVAVLQAFIKAFENSSVTILFLKTQFDFSSNLDSCLLPGTSCVEDQNEETKCLIRALMEYKHYEEYATYYNLELPPEQSENVIEVSYLGIAGLSKLKILLHEHISRELFIPVKDEDKKWYDYACKFRSTTLSSEDYYISKESHQEILKLPSLKYVPKNIKVNVTPFFVTPVKHITGCSAPVKIMPSMLLPDKNIKLE